MSTVFDVIVIGGGPAGLAAAITSASEGLTTVLVDSKDRLGGQATQSSSVENYPGFPNGIAGNDLMAKFMMQAGKFDTRFVRPARAHGLVAGDDGCIEVLTDDDDDSKITGRTAILALGLSYTKLSAPGIADLLGRGVFYGAPNEFTGKSRHVCIIGGANSAGQAAMNLANQGHRVTLLVRGPSIRDKMSTYLVTRIEACANVEVVTNVEVTRASGREHLEKILVSSRGSNAEERMIDTDELCVFIGASPKTQWLRHLLQTTPRGYILTGGLLKDMGERVPLAFETSLPGVFACGDVREGSIKRIASAVGEGTVAVQQVHEFRARKHT